LTPEIDAAASIATRCRVAMSFLEDGFRG